MGVRITDPETFAIYDSVTGTAFGPIFETAQQAQGFLSFVELVYGNDARALSYVQMQEAFASFIDGDPCINLWPEHATQTFQPCEHHKLVHDEDGCKLCPCGKYRDDGGEP